MSEEERTVEREPEPADDRTADGTGGETSADAGAGDGPAVYGGDEVTTAFNDRVEAAPTDGVGRVTGLTREPDGDRLVLTVETDAGEHAAFALEDPADGHLDGRLRRLCHEIGVTDGDATGAMVPLTTVDGQPAIDWERVPAAPANPSRERPAETTDPDPDSLAATVRARAGGLALWETLLAVGGGVLAGGLALVAGAGGATALAGAALLQVLVATALVLRARLLQSEGVEE